MTATSYGPQTRRPVVHRGERITGLFERTTIDGGAAYEVRRKVDGKSITRALVATTATDAIREARAFVTDAERGARIVGNSDASLQELRDEFAAWAQKSDRFAPSTRGLYLGRLDKHVLPALGATTKAANVTPAHLRAMIEKLTKKGGSGSSVRGCVIAAAALFRFGVHRGVIDRNPCRDLERGDRPSAKRKSEPRYLDAVQIGALLGELGDEFRPVAACCAYGAMRVSEALALKWADIDFTAGMIAVPGTKTERSAQSVPMISALTAELQTHRKRIASKSLVKARNDALVFTTATGQPQDRRNILRAVYAAGDAAGLNGNVTTPKAGGAVERDREPVGLHDLRHSCAGLLLAAGVSMPKVAAVLRHSNPRITADVYAGLVETSRAELGVDLTAAFAGGN